MFVRKKLNKSGIVSVQVIDKHGGYRVVKTVGSSRDQKEIEQLVADGWRFIDNRNGNQQGLISLLNQDEQAVETFLTTLPNSAVRTVGPELIFGTLFDRIGFNSIKDNLFRHLVVARLAFPLSKLKTVDYLYRYSGITMSVDQVYRFLDRLQKKHKETVEKIAFNYTKRHLKKITVVFYDMTTLYFEAEDEDDLRKIGFSKDGKFQQPQIMVGLLVGENGYPIGYDIFEGNTFEGHTLIPTLKKIQQKYVFDKPVVIADAALMNKDNIKDLSGEEYCFILGARIKNETESMKRKILRQVKKIKENGHCILKRPDGTRLIVTYSESRAKKDAHNREKGVLKLKKRVKSGKLTKSNINNKGYNKFLSLDGDITVTVDEIKIKDDKKWDGLKGYITNTRLQAKKVVENYSHLWQIEKAFRISKTDLQIRPIYHRGRERIEAHVCIAFTAYTVYKELERLLKKNKSTISLKRASELTHTMYGIEYKLPHGEGRKQAILQMDKEQQELYEIIHK